MPNVEHIEVTMDDPRWDNNIPRCDDSVPKETLLYLAERCRAGKRVVFPSGDAGHALHAILWGENTKLTTEGMTVRGRRIRIAEKLEQLAEAGAWEPKNLDCGW